MVTNYVTILCFSKIALKITYYGNILCDYILNKIFFCDIKINLLYQQYNIVQKFGDMMAYLPSEDAKQLKNGIVHIHKMLELRKFRVIHQKLN